MTNRMALNPLGIVKLLPRNILSLTVFKWTLPLSIILAIVSTPKSISNSKEVAIWLVIGLSGHLAMLPFVLYGRDKSFGEQLLLVMLMGFIRGGVISVLAPLFEVEDLLTPVGRISNSMMAVLYWSQAGSIIVEYGVEFRKKLRNLLTEVLEKNISGLPEAAKRSNNTVVEIIGHLQSQILKVIGSEPSKEQILGASREIDALINNHIKPLSQSQWKDGELTWIRAGFPKVLKRTLSLNPIPVVAVIALTLPFTLVAQISSIGIWLTLLVQLFWTSTVLILVLVIYRKKPKTDDYYKKNLLFLVTLPIAYGFTFIMQSFGPLDNSQNFENMARGYFMSALTQIAAYLIGSLLLAFRNDQEFVFEFLSDVIKAGELDKLLSKTNAGNLDSNYAQYLHAEVQSQLLACKLLLLKAAESNFELFPPEITRQITERMEKIKQPYQRPADRIPAKRLAELQASWAGLAKLNYSLAPEFSELHGYSDVASQLIEEAVVNSIRHGKASEIEIVGTGTESAIEVSVSDNGGISNLAPGGGLGTVLFNTFTKSWSLDQRGSQTVLTFTLSKGENI